MTSRPRGATTGGDRPNLAEAEIVRAALTLARRVGLDGISMRALADELGVTTMAAYHHVRNKDALLDLVANTVLDTVGTPADGDWTDRLRVQNRAMRTALLTYPGLAAYLMERPLTTSGRRLAADGLGMLTGAGFGEREARLAAATLQAFLLGRLSIETGSTVRRKASPGDGTAEPLRADEVFEYGLSTIIEALRGALPGGLPEDHPGTDERSQA